MEPSSTPPPPPRRRSTLLFAIVAVALLLATVLPVPPASAGAPTDQLRTQVDRVLKLLDDPTLKDKPKDKRAAVRKVAEEIFDFGETARRSLGRHWADRTEADRVTDKRRDPVNLLTFTGAKTGWTVLDMGAGAGYSTELMAPSLMLWAMASSGSSSAVWQRTDSPRLKTRWARLWL